MAVLKHLTSKSSHDFIPTRKAPTSKSDENGVNRLNGVSQAAKAFALFALLLIPCIWTQISTARNITLNFESSRFLSASDRNTPGSGVEDSYGANKPSFLRPLRYTSKLSYGEMKQTSPSSVHQFDHDTHLNLTSSDLKIAWLMSFPNSGTSYTGQLIRTIAQTMTASNYGCEDKKEITTNSIPVYEDQPSGPFYVDVDRLRHPERKEPQRFVLAKTHCGIRCEDCPPRKYIETISSFRHRCLSSSWGEEVSDGKFQLMFGAYPAARVAKAIHLLRDPFDNIVSRFHLELHESEKRNLKDDSPQYSPNRDGFRRYCLALNAKYADEESQFDFLTDELNNLTAKIPCRTDFLRYTEWHNLAFITTQDMGLDTYILHYDDYATNFKKTVAELLNFLELEAQAEPELFQMGKVYQDYFTDDERVRVGLAIKMMSSTTTWRNVERYFEYL